MSQHISKSLRARVIDRANFKCEYCLFNSEHSFLPFHIEHIIAIKHGGQSKFDNLAYACPHCNAHKGTDLTTIIQPGDKLTPLFNPRVQVWSAHFREENGKIFSISDIGKATIKLLKVNEPERLRIRKLLADCGLYP